MRTRRRRPRPDSDFRRHRRRRPLRQAQGLRRKAESGQRPGSRLRRRVGRRGAVPALHPRSRRRRRARRRAGDPARRLGLRRTRTKRSTRSSGGPTAGSTAATACSRTRTSASRARPTDERMPLNAAIWRYHPTRHEFEVFAEGTSNPWGVDFDDHGQAFSTACVIPHLYHIIQGGRYQRQAGQHFNPYTYDDIKTIADHLPLPRRQPARRQRPLGRRRRRPRPRRRDDLSGRRLAREYRNQIFMNNIHGQRINIDILEPQGSGFVGSHGPDFLLTQDDLVADSQPPLRARRPGLHHRLVRHATPAITERRRPRSHERPDLQDQLRRCEDASRSI